MPKSTFDTEQEANDYKREHQLFQRVAVPLIGRGKWALIFPIEAHITVNDGAPDGMREPSGSLKFNQHVGFQLGGFTVGHAATMTRCNAVGTIVGVEDRDGRLFVTVEFEEPQPVDCPEGSTNKRFELTHTNITSTWAKPVGDRNLSNYIEHSASGKTGTFAAKYDQHAERNGQTFTVLGAVDPKTYDATECGEMFSIRFADGVQIDAWPEEVESAMNEARLVNNDEEVVVKLADGCTLRSGVYDPHIEGALTSGEYVRLCDPDGEEILYWDQEEWANDPALVMGAIMNAAAGLRVHHVDSPSPGM